MTGFKSKRKMAQEDDDIQEYVRPWVDLTAREIELAYAVTIKIRKKDIMPGEQEMFARTIQQLLRSKNTRLQPARMLIRAGKVRQTRAANAWLLERQHLTHETRLQRPKTTGGNHAKKRGFCYNWGSYSAALDMDARLCFD